MSILSTMNDRRYEKMYSWIKVARIIGELSTCDRAQVGAVIIRDGRVVSSGYNGAPPGQPHCDENNHGWWDDESGEGCLNAVHAELNAIAAAARHGVSTDGATLYVTLSPCIACQRLLIAAGISEVVYDAPYREPCDLLEQAGVPCNLLTL